MWNSSFFLKIRKDHKGYVGDEMAYLSMFKSLLLIILILSCSLPGKQKPKEATVPVQKSFSSEELILANELLNKIFDQEMAPIECVPNTDEAGLLLRTIRPRMEIVEDDMEASLDDNKEIERLINTCNEVCICQYVDDLLREHQVSISQNLKKIINQKKSDKEMSRCLNYARSTFCQSDLFKELNKEKVEFSFEEMP